jgi:pyridinium-3,5-bisthiocarboxylic acid mononucleotide nickel chelatase
VIELRGLHLHVDCASGAAGDMLLGALLDLGVPVAVVAEALDAIGAGRQRLRIARVVKGGISATDIKVDTTGQLAAIPAPARRDPWQADDATGERTEIARLPLEHLAADAERTQALQAEDLARLIERAGEPAEHRSHPHTLPRAHGHHHDHDHSPGQEHGHDHDHDHHHGHADRHVHVRYADIRRRLIEAPLSEGTRRRALDIFDRIARAEARLHGTTVDAVQFHEVGAIDSIVDVVGTAAALDYLAPASVSCTSVAMGHGTIHCAHGVLPVPAPAALEVLREAGGVMVDGGVARELCTPTGAAILAAAVTRWEPAPGGRAVGVGWGAGDADLDDRANVLRVVALAPAPAAPADEVWQIDANVDDMSPELCAPALDAVLAAGALDAWWTPITMKKGRPALALSVLATTAKRAAVIAAILRETTTIGVRFAPRERTVLERSLVEVTTPYGAIPIKVARDGDAVLNAAPEYESCAAAARSHGVALKLVYAAALAAWARQR